MALSKVRWLDAREQLRVASQDLHDDGLRGVRGTRGPRTAGDRGARSEAQYGNAYSADAARGADRTLRPRPAAEPRDRRTAMRQPPDSRVSPAQCVHQAR